LIALVLTAGNTKNRHKKACPS